VCTLEADLTSAPSHIFVLKKITKKKKVRQVNFDLSLTISSAELKFQLDSGGKIYGKVTATFD
jgi:hypothetical protein